MFAPEHRATTANRLLQELHAYISFLFVKSEHATVISYNTYIYRCKKHIKDKKQKTNKTTTSRQIMNLWLFLIFLFNMFDMCFKQFY